MLMKMQKTAASVLILIFLWTSAAGVCFGQTASSTPAKAGDGHLLLVQALERCQGEVIQSRERVRLLENREKALETQVEVEKENGRLTNQIYRTAVAELGEVRAALSAAKEELKLRERQEKDLKRKIRRLRGELWMTRAALVGVAGFFVYLLAAGGAKD